MAPDLDAGQENLRVEDMEIADKEGVVAVPGASELMSHLPRERFAIVTSATQALAEARLRHANLPVGRGYQDVFSPLWREEDF